MKKCFALALMAVLSVALVACASTNSSSMQGDSASAPTESLSSSSSASLLDLTGEWEQSNKDSETNYQTAIITDDSIEVYWIDNADDTKSLYWAGSYIAPDSSDNSYTWESANDTEKTKSALLASSADTKTFIYENGQISYDVSALGVTKTVKLEKLP